MLFRSNDTATTEIYTSSYTLSLHDALPIWVTGVAVDAVVVDRSTGTTAGRQAAVRFIILSTLSFTLIA